MQPSLLWIYAQKRNPREGIMKKKILISVIIMLMAISSVAFYSNYARKRVQYHVNILNTISNGRTHPFLLEGFAGKVELQGVIKQSPGELIMLVKWGDEDAFVSIENWLGKHTGRMMVRVFEKGKGFARY